MEQSSTHNGNPQEQKEGPVARAIEEQTAKIPSDVFLWAAGGAIALSLAFEVIGTRRTFYDRMFGRKRAPLATFVGQWVPTLLLLGVYNKIVKVAGSDRTSQGSERGSSGSEKGNR